MRKVAIMPASPVPSLLFRFSYQFQIVAGISTEPLFRAGSHLSVAEGSEFSFAGDLAEKRRQLANVEKALVADIEGTDDAKAIVA
jgi:hypothetical protein